MAYIVRRLRRYVSILAPMVMMLLMLSSSNTKAAPTYQTPTPQAQQPARPNLLTDPVPDPRQPGVLYFPATGHTLRGAFLDYWNRYGGLTQFGYPITEEFFEEVGPDHKQYQVQYFERNRFERHPENAGTPSEVLLGTLGRDFRTQDPHAPPISDATYFKETGHNLSGKFKQYWDTHGGLFVHGFPITEAVMEKSPTDGKTYMVQWFERSRFELHPENAGTLYEVLVGLLGRQLSEKKGFPFGWYPLYGYAADYSWFAGYYKADPRRCALCGCSTVRFVSPSITTYHSAVEVWPYFENAPRRMSLDVKGLVSTVEPQTFIVVFGKLDDPGTIASDGPTASCLSPKFRVTSLQFNPAR